MMDDLQAALRLSEAIDRVQEQENGAGTTVGPEAGMPDEDQALLDVAGRLVGLNRALGPARPELEQRVAGVIQTQSRRPRVRLIIGGGASSLRRLKPILHKVTSPGEQEPVAPERGRRIGWPSSDRRRAAIALVAAAVALVVLLAGPGRSTLARFGSSVKLGPVEIRFQTATETAGGARPAEVSTSERHFGSLRDAQAVVGRPLLAPVMLPAGYALRDVAVVYYDEMPRWLGQPLFVNLAYGQDAGSPPLLEVRQYFVSLGPERDLSSLRFSDDQVRDSRPVDVDGQAGLLLTLQDSQAGSGRAPVPLLLVVWQQNGLLVEVSAPAAADAGRTGGLTADELLSIARSVK